jgi:hypothetical protein
MSAAPASDGVEHSKLETNDLAIIQGFLEQNADKLETAELAIRSSAGTYIAELRPTNGQLHSPWHGSDEMRRLGRAFG